MTATTPKLKFDFDYWINRLVEVGRTTDPDKYTPGYISLMKYKWRKEPFTKLHLFTRNRIKQIQLTINL